MTMFAPAAAESYVVVVNSENSFSGSPEEVKTVLRRLYLKQQKNWPSGENAIGFARPLKADAEIAFRRSVLGMSNFELARHWLQLKQKSGDTPHRTISSGRILIQQIRTKKNAFAVISKNDLEKFGSDEDEIRVLFEFENHMPRAAQLAR